MGPSFPAWSRQQGGSRQAHNAQSRACGYLIGLASESQVAADDTNLPALAHALHSRRGRPGSSQKTRRVDLLRSGNRPSRPRDLPSSGCRNRVRDCSGGGRSGLLSPFQRMALYAVAILAVGFGIEWGFSYIFEAHSGRRAKKKSLSEGLPWGGRPRSPARADTVRHRRSLLGAPLRRRRGHSKEGR